MFEGTHTALVTPFRNGDIDEEAFRRLVDFQFENGIAGVVPVGTTGESPTLNHDEHIRAIKLAVEFTGGRGHVIAGTGSNSTQEAIDLTIAAENAGANAALLVCPYYNKPSQEGLYQHYKAISQSSGLDLILYSIPGRSCIQIDSETTARLQADCPNIVAMKEAGGTVERVKELRALVPDTFEILSGDDALTVDFMKAGAVGVISVASNLIPKVMADLTKAMLEGDTAAAETLHARYEPLFSAFLRLDTNPVPIKAALGLTGQCDPFLRLPMIQMGPEKLADLRTIMVSLGLL
jgi:4-hydroxy-tetrahydrodipicolinate synthase